MLKTERQEEEHLATPSTESVESRSVAVGQLIDAAIALPVLLVEVAWLAALGYGAYRLLHLL